MTITQHGQYRGSLLTILRTYWLGLGCTALAIITGIETWGFVQVGIITGTLQVGLCTMCAVLTFALPLRPAVLAWPLLSTALILDVLRVTSPNGVFLTVMLIIVVLAYQSPTLGFLSASFPFVAALYVTVYEGGYPIWICSSVVQYACWYYSMAFVGQWARKRAELAALKQRERQRDTRERFQRQLHDTVANDLTYLVAMLEYRTATDQQYTGDTAIQEMGDIARNALRATRQIIDLLENDASQSDEENPVKHHDGHELAMFMNHNDRRLHELGFRGKSIFNTSDDIGMPDNVKILSGSLIREIYCNILKYAEPTAYYAVAVRVTYENITITASDVPRLSSNKTFNSSHSGLRRHTKAILQSGGTVDIRETATEWHLTANIPLSTEKLPTTVAG
ncbi:histidine kinase [Bifidobacterium pullorum]|uniref:histidine kinase n=1 Tax=Bifidobacterium pullorum TaxID=78448 RepID=UPI003F22666B